MADSEQLCDNCQHDHDAHMPCVVTTCMCTEGVWRKARETQEQRDSRPAWCAHEDACYGSGQCKCTPATMESARDLFNGVGCDFTESNYRRHGRWLLSQFNGRRASITVSPQALVLAFSGELALKPDWVDDRTCEIKADALRDRVIAAMANCVAQSVDPAAAPHRSETVAKVFNAARTRMKSGEKGWSDEHVMWAICEAYDSALDLFPYLHALRGRVDKAEARANEQAAALAKAKSTIAELEDQARKNNREATVVTATDTGSKHASSMTDEALGEAVRLHVEHMDENEHDDDVGQWVRSLFAPREVELDREAIAARATLEANTKPCTRDAEIGRGHGWASCCVRGACRIAIDLTLAAAPTEWRKRAEEAEQARDRAKSALARQTQELADEVSRREAAEKMVAELRGQLEVVRDARNAYRSELTDLRNRAPEPEVLCGETLGDFTEEEIDAATAEAHAEQQKRYPGSCTVFLPGSADFLNRLFARRRKNLPRVTLAELRKELHSAGEFGEEPSEDLMVRSVVNRLGRSIVTGPDPEQAKRIAELELQLADAEQKTRAAKEAVRAAEDRGETLLQRIAATDAELAELRKRSVQPAETAQPVIQEGRVLAEVKTDQERELSIRAAVRAELTALLRGVARRVIGSAHTPTASPGEAVSPAVRALADLITGLSEQAYCAGWLVGIEYEVWAALLGTPLPGSLVDLDPFDRGALERLSQECGGWVRWDDAADGGMGDIVFVPMDEWHALVAVKRG